MFAHSCKRHLLPVTLLVPNKGSFVRYVITGHSGSKYIGIGTGKMGNTRNERTQKQQLLARFAFEIALED